MALTTKERDESAQRYREWTYERLERAARLWIWNVA